MGRWRNPYIEVAAEVTGINEIRDDFRRMDKDVQRGARKSVRKATNYLRDKVKADTPKKTGNLKKNTKSRVRGMVGQVVVDQESWYYLVVEYGSAKRGTAGTLYSSKVLEREQPKAAQMIEEGVLKAVYDVAGKW